MCFWRRRRDPLGEMASGVARQVLSESTRIALEKIASEWVKEDLAYIRSRLYERMNERYGWHRDQLLGRADGEPDGRR
jgi:hypothetical protein